MANRRFSEPFLFELRNHIPIDALISQVLTIPNKINEGNFRFLCPTCREFNAGIYRKSNLACCYSCKSRFNTIEIVMEWNQMDFVRAVEYLSPYLRKTHNAKHQEKSRSDQTDKKQVPVKIGMILKNIIPDQIKSESMSQAKAATPESTKSEKLIIERIDRIEVQLTQLMDQLQSLEKRIR